MISPCEMSSPSPKFLDACSKFPDVPLLRPNLSISPEWFKDGAGGALHRQAIEEVLCHGNASL